MSTDVLSQIVNLAVWEIPVLDVKTMTDVMIYASLMELVERRQRMIRAEWTNNDALSAEQTTQSNQMVEPRYIKATDVISVLSLFYNYTDAERYDLALAISAVPTADVVERKKGKWIDEKINSYTSRTYCSECGNPALFICVSGDHYGRNMHGEVKKTKFCPDCGVYMGGGGD